jgi:hypothetical protein
MGSLAVSLATAIALETRVSGGRVSKHQAGERVAIELRFKRDNPMLQIAWSEVYVPYDLDTHDEWLRPETVRKMAHEFIRRLIEKGHLGIDVDHDNRPGRAEIAETFVARDGDPDFTPGAWVIGIHFLDPQLWDEVLKGEKGGVSFQAWVNKVVRTVEVATESQLAGVTTKHDGHDHEFSVRLDERGNVIHGATQRAPDGHFHRIRENVRTDMAAGHRHGFTIARSITGVAA